jgi:hypothetical protein
MGEMMKPRSTEFYADAYAYAVGYRDGREGNNVALPDVGLFTEHHQTIYRDGYEQGKRDYYRNDHHDATPAYAPLQGGL